MLVKLTDEQIARVLNLCEAIGRIKQEIPQPPRGLGYNAGFTIAAEIAKTLRASLEAKNDMLLELGALLRTESEQAAE